MTAHAPHPGRKPLFDPYELGRSLGTLLRQVRALLERRPPAPPAADTSIAWEDGETDETSRNR
jgi:hypothetical protein